MSTDHDELVAIRRHLAKIDTNVFIIALPIWIVLIAAVAVLITGLFLGIAGILGYFTL